MPEPLVVVIAYHGADDVAEAAASVEPHDVLVVDNSASHTVRAAAERAGARYLDSGANLGFAQAVNLSLDRAAGRDVVLVNPDARAPADVVDRLVSAVHPADGTRVAASAPRLVGADGSDQRTAWPFPTPAGAWAVAAGVGRFQRADRGFLAGAVLALNAEAVAEVGPFDPSYFLYGEESDWQRRAVSAGWEVRLVPEVTATHVGGASSSDEVRRETHFHAGTERHVRHWHGTVGWQSYRAATVLGAVARGVVLPGERGRVARRRARLFLRGPMRCEAELT